MLYAYFGIGFTSSVLLIAGLIFLNFYLAKLTAKFTKRVMGAKDNRMNTTTEALDNIQHIKFNSWIDRFINHIDSSRKVEEKWISQRYNLATVNFGIMSIIQPLLSFSTFAVSVLWLGHSVTLGSAVAGLQILTLLQEPTRWMPFFLGVIMQFQISIK